LILASFILLCSCKKQGEEVHANSNKFKVGIGISSLVCFPDDSISLSFQINAADGKPPYSYNWINPAGLKGAGPFTINVKSDVTLQVEVVDSIDDKVNLQYLIKKDTIDSLKYDFRNMFTGIYACEVIYRWATLDSNGVIHGHDTTYSDTLTVSKHAQFNMLKISNLPDVKYYARPSKFIGFRTTVTFTGDTIDAYYYQTPLALYNWTFKGIKIKTMAARRN